MDRPIFADFNSLDEDGFIRLNCVGTINDLRERSIQLKVGDHLVVSDGDLTAEVRVRAPGSEGVLRGQFVTKPVDRNPWIDPKKSGDTRHD